MREYLRRPEQAEKARERARRYRTENYNIVLVKDRARGYRETDKQKEHARNATRKLDRQPCEQCGALPADAHHDDYSKPLDVRWLCESCHGIEHRRF